jgi:3-hydroxymyristoyl/3-hydroxydecanoyl-(acyl carrier protein) dehydratase
MTMRRSIAAARIHGPRREGEGAAVFEFRFGADDPTFAGHFPGRPLLPGAFQLEMARAAAEWTLDCPLAVREVCRAKFRRPILPDEIVRLELKWSEARGVIQARAALSVDGQPAGESVLQLWRSA